MTAQCPRCHTENPDDSLFCAKCGTQIRESEEMPLPTRTIEAPKEELTTGSTFAGRYQIIEELGRGGMGRVYRAKDTKLHEEVALKLIKPEIASSKKTIERFGNELRLARKVRHKNIGSMYELLEEEGTSYITMEYVPGQDLKGLIRQSGNLAINTSLSIARQICEGLSEAHKAGVIHRDLKPSNIMIDREGNVRIMDFGIARSLEEKGITGAGVMVGTPYYMSPEQAETKAVDQRSDIYSLGVILYEMVTGRVPFEGDTALSIAMKHKSESPKNPKEYNAQIPDDLSRLILKCLEKDKESRYQSAGEVRLEIDKIEGEIPTVDRIIPKKKPLTSKEITLTLGLRKLFMPVLAVVVLIIIAIVLVWHPWSQEKGIAYKERDWILITDFENLTGDEVFNRTLNTALTVAIEQSSYVNVFPRARVKETLQRMGRKVSDQLDQELGLEVAQREGIKAIVSGSINQMENVYTLSASIIDPSTHMPLKTEASQSVGKEGVLDALDELAREIRKSLGESLKEINSESIDLPKATTVSLEALKYFADGQKAMESSQNAEAKMLLENAIKLDPDFALAHMALGSLYYREDDRIKGEEHFGKVMGLLDRLTERERLWIQAFIPDSRGNDQDAILNYKVFLTKYPDDYKGWSNLGKIYMLQQRFSDAISTLKKATELNPYSAGTYISIAQCYAGIKDFQQAVNNYQKAFELSPVLMMEGVWNRVFGFTYVAMGEVQKAKEVFEKLLTGDDNDKARGHRHLALLNMYLGKFSDAITHLKESILLNHTLNNTLSELRDRLYLTTAYRSKGMMDAFNEELYTINEIRKNSYIGPWWLQVAGKKFARQGKIAQADSLLEELSRKMNEKSNNDRAAFNILKGEIELGRGNHSEGLKIIEVASKLRGDIYVLESLAYAYFINGDLEKATVTYENLLSLQDMPFGWEGQEYWILAHYRLGKIYERQGNTAKAIENYKKFLDIWKDADPGIAEVDDVRERLAALTRNQ